MSKRKFYYIIEELDIDGDKQADGFLISQYRLDKQNNKIFTKNKYTTFKDFNNYVRKNKGKLEKKGGQKSVGQLLPVQNNNDLVFLTKEQYNNFMNMKQTNQFPHQHYNDRYRQQHYPSNYPSNYPSYYPSHYQQHSHQHPPPVMVQGSGGFMSNLTSGIGIGAGVSIGDSLMDGFMGMF